ncbi:SDR family NAD(P)-dependent oxidoreductase [Ancylobacter pratisalsi]|uniref:SDR family NAD(P)-dependent oxidoreductase n=1 Tax=Ancylobacter pratisalsi TaxID=1745854 RepID=A0A6P1YMS8_9HYPH|nr:SDR family NAD(P)-dependent oxidoreductase [Ancylobacter pratisalsi]QIB34619.1 SDR family NAD(P)-dependent oxidoreductase [Ancylobacter pratisalsi]
MTVRTALISGGNRGIGAATGRALAGAGWNVSLGMRAPVRPDWADTVPGAIHVHAYDATEPASAAAWVAAARERFGGIDAVVANAGIMVRKDVIEAEDADLEALMQVNVAAPRTLVKAAWEDLVATGRGRVIIVSSLSGKRVKSAISGLYSVSKFAATGLAHAIRHVGFEHGIRVTAVCPGFVATDMGLPLADVPASELTSPEDIARSIAFLIELPNTSSVAEFAVNCRLEESF